MNLLRGRGCDFEKVSDLGKASDLRSWEGLRFWEGQQFWEIKRFLRRLAILGRPAILRRSAIVRRLQHEITKVLVFLMPLFRTGKTVLHQGNENTVSRV